MKKYISLLLTAALLLGLLSGCSVTETTEETTEETADENVIELDAGVVVDPNAEAFDYEAALAAFNEGLELARGAFPADTVVAVCNGQEITWEMFCYFVTDELQQFFFYLGGLPTDFGEEVLEGTSMEQYLRDSAVSGSLYYLVAHAKALELDVKLTEEQEAELVESWNALVEQYGGEEALIADLEAAFLSEDLFKFLLRCNTELAALCEELVGANGEKLTDEEVLTWAEENKYVRVKHVLFAFDDADEAGRAELLEKANAIVDELRKLQDDPAALEALFDEYMAESDDPGSAAGFPDGYVFTFGTMVDEFEDAAYALDLYGVSDPVETTYGYHVLLRLEMSADSLTSDQDANTGAYMTLRQDAANILFSEQLMEWINAARDSVEWGDGFEELDFNTLFYGAE